MKNNSVSKYPNGHVILKRKKTQRTNKYMRKYSLTIFINFCLHGTTNQNYRDPISPLSTISQLISFFIQPLFQERAWWPAVSPPLAWSSSNTSVELKTTNVARMAKEKWNIILHPGLHSKF